MPGTVLGRGEFEVKPKELDLETHYFMGPLVIYSRDHMFLQNLQL